jgi:hypothetical protein
MKGELIMKEKVVVIKTMREMQRIIRLGFDLFKVEDDKDNTKYKVFLFKDTEELQNILKNK